MYVCMYVCACVRVCVCVCVSVSVCVCVCVCVGSRVAKGEKILSLEAMKMQTTVYAPADGIISEIPIKVGDAVEAKDLLMKLKAG